MPTALRLLLCVSLLGVSACSRSGFGERTNGDTTSDRWWDTQWTQRRPYKFTSNTASESFDDFPVYIEIDEPEFDLNSLAADGTDVRFIDQDGSPLAFEQQRTTPPFSYWVRIPRLDAGDSDFLWMYYGGPAGPPPLPATSTWAPAFVGVWHLDENGNDATANANHGEVIEAAPADGIFGPAVLFTETAGQRVEIPDSDSLHAPQTSVTVSGWVQRRLNQPTWRAVASRAIGIGGNNDLWLGFHNDLYRGIISETAANQAVVTGGLAPTGDWLWLVGAYDGTQVALYVNGEVEPDSVAAFSGTLTNSPNPLYIGADTNDGGVSTIDEIYAIIDEVRLESAGRSPEWIRAQYQTMTNTLGEFLAAEAF